MNHYRALLKWVLFQNGKKPGSWTVYTCSSHWKDGIYCFCFLDINCIEKAALQKSESWSKRSYISTISNVFCFCLILLLFIANHCSSLIDVVYCDSMWVKKCSVLYLSPQNLSIILLSFLHPSSLKPSLPACTSVVFFHGSLNWSALLPLQVFLCPSSKSVQTNPTEQILRTSWERQNMAVARCPDYFLHHPNYQVNSMFVRYCSLSVSVLCLSDRISTHAHIHL